MKKTTYLALVFGILVLGYLVIASFQKQPFRCRVCLTYDGRTNCATGAAKSESDAMRTALTTACEPLAGGVIESGKCEATRPDSVEWLAGR